MRLFHHNVYIYENNVSEYRGIMPSLKFLDTSFFMTGNYFTTTYGHIQQSSSQVAYFGNTKP